MEDSFGATEILVHNKVSENKKKVFHSDYGRSRSSHGSRCIWEGSAGRVKLYLMKKNIFEGTQLALYCYTTALKSADESAADNICTNMH